MPETPHQIYILLWVWTSQAPPSDCIQNLYFPPGINKLLYQTPLSIPEDVETPADLKLRPQNSKHFKVDTGRDHKLTSQESLGPPCTSWLSPLPVRTNWHGFWWGHPNKWSWQLDSLATSLLPSRFSSFLILKSWINFHHSNGEVIWSQVFRLQHGHLQLLHVSASYISLPGGLFLQENVISADLVSSHYDGYHYLSKDLHVDSHHFVFRNWCRTWNTSICFQGLEKEEKQLPQIGALWVMNSMVERVFHESNAQLNTSPPQNPEIPHRHCSCVGGHIHRRPVGPRRVEEVQGDTPGGTCEGKTIQLNLFKGEKMIFLSRWFHTGSSGFCEKNVMKLRKTRLWCWWWI